jgi:archaellum biogenesis ATPase FlaH
MYRKEVNERSPMRVFEKSIHGGLGRGKLGVVASKAGVGKTPLLVQIALDDLMRDRNVLHISHDHAADHVRAFYSELFHDLAQSSRLEDPATVELELERNRLILSLMSHSADAPMSARGGQTSIGRILEAVGFAKDVTHFTPDVIIIDGFDFAHGNEQAFAELRHVAEVQDVELWLSAVAEKYPTEGGGLPKSVERYAELVDVIVFLKHEDPGAVRLHLLKDHENTNIADLNLLLDPTTMRIMDDQIPPPSGRPADPRRFRMLSGGCKGAEAAFGACAEKWGMREVNYAYEGNKSLVRKRGIRVLDDEELSRGEFSLVYASRRLGRSLTKIPSIRKVLQTIWHQITNAKQVFAVGVIQDDDTVRGGTGWGAELCRLWKKPIFVFDQEKRAWFRWTGKAWEMAKQPIITKESFAGIGTQTLSDAGRDAIEDLFLRSFGPPGA